MSPRCFTILLSLFSTFLFFDMFCGFLDSAFKYNKFFRLARMCQKSLLEFNIDMDLSMFYKIIRTMRGSTIIHGSDSFVLLDRFIPTVNFTVIDVERRMPVQEKKMLSVSPLLSYFYKTGRLRLNSFARSWSAFYTWEATAIDVLVNNEAGGLTISYTTGLNLPTVTWLARPHIPKMIDYPRLLGYHHMFRFGSSWFFSYNSTSYTVLSSMSYNSASVSRTLSILDFLSNRFDNEGLGILYGRSAVVYRSSFFKPWFYTFCLSRELLNSNNLLFKKNFFGNFLSFKFSTPDVWDYLIGELGKVSLDNCVLVKFQDIYRKRFFSYSRWFYSNFLLNQESRYYKNLAYYKHIWIYLFFVLKKRFRSWYLTFIKLKKYPTVTTFYSFVFYGDFVRQSLQLGCGFEGLSKPTSGIIFLARENRFCFNHLCYYSSFLNLIKPFFIFLRYTFDLLKNLKLSRNQYVISVIRDFRNSSGLSAFRFLNGITNYNHFYRQLLNLIKLKFGFYKKICGHHFLKQVVDFLIKPFCGNISNSNHIFNFNLLTGINSVVQNYLNKENLINFIKTNKIVPGFKLYPPRLFISFMKNSMYVSNLIKPRCTNLEKISFNLFFFKFIFRVFSQIGYKPFIRKNKKKRLRRRSRRDPVRAIRRFLFKVSITNARKKRIQLKLKRYRVSDFSIESSLVTNHIQPIWSLSNNPLGTSFFNTNFLIKKSKYKIKRPIVIPIRGHLKTLMNSGFNGFSNNSLSGVRSSFFINSIVSDVNFILLFLKNQTRYVPTTKVDFENKRVYFFNFNRPVLYNYQPKISLLFQRILNSSLFFSSISLIRKIFKFIRFLSKSYPSIQVLTNLFRFLPLITVILKLFLMFRLRFGNVKPEKVNSSDLLHSYKVFSFGLFNKIFSIDRILKNFIYQFNYPTDLSLISISSQKINELNFIGLIRFRFFIQKILPDFVFKIFDQIILRCCYKFFRKKNKSLGRVVDFRKLKLVRKIFEILYLSKKSLIKLIEPYLTFLGKCEFGLLKTYKFVIIPSVFYFFNPKVSSFLMIFINFVRSWFVRIQSRFYWSIYSHINSTFLVLSNFKNDFISRFFFVFYDLVIRFHKFKNFFESKRITRHNSLTINRLRLFLKLTLWYRCLRVNNRYFLFKKPKRSMFSEIKKY